MFFVALFFMHVMSTSVLIFSVYPNFPGPRKAENNLARLRPAVRVGVVGFEGTTHHDMSMAEVL